MNDRQPFGEQTHGRMGQAAQRQPAFLSPIAIGGMLALARAMAVTELQALTLEVQEQLEAIGVAAGLAP